MKKTQKDSDYFWRRKLTVKVIFWHFLTPPNYTNLQNSMISFNCSWFLVKNLSNFVSLFWNSTTCAAVIQGVNADYGEWPWQISVRKWKKGIHLLNGNSLMFAYFSTQKCFLFCFKISMEHTFINVVVFCWTEIGP